MTEYVCPVGALTAKDFRFKARVWFLRSVPSVCVGCATGCNSYTDYDPRYQKVYRYRPRQNLAVNKYWMCDEGMLDYRRIHEGRVLEARAKGKRVEPEGAIAKAVAALGKADVARVAVVLSAEHSQEENFSLLNLAREGLKLGAFFVAGRPRGEGDEILRHPDKNPNARGVAQLFGSAAAGARAGTLRSAAELEKELEAGVFDVVLSLGSNAEATGLSAALGKAKDVIAICSHAGVFEKAATVLLPASTWAESDGTFVNAQGRAQVSRQAIQPRGDSRPAWGWVAELSTALGHPVSYEKVTDVRRAMQPPARQEAASQAQPGAAE
jgi:NADH-quinone oxidoreductase subunit G